MTASADVATSNFTDKFLSLIDRDIDGLLSDDEREELWQDDNIEDIRLALLETLEIMSDQVRSGDVEIEKYRSRCISEGPVGKSKFFHARNEWLEKRAELSARKLRTQGLISEAKTLIADLRRRPASASDKEARQKRGQEINDRLDRIEVMVSRLVSHFLGD